MITKLSIDGFKSLRDISLDTRRLNVLVGPNSTGKSSVLQVMLLLRQSCDSTCSVSTINLSGDLFEGGTARDVLHPESSGGFLIRIESDGISNGNHLFSPRSVDNWTVDRWLGTADPVTLPPALCDFTGKQFAYLSAERLGPRITYPLQRDGRSLSGPVGSHGEFTTGFLARNREDGTTIGSDWYKALLLASEAMPEDLMLDEGSEKNLSRLDLFVQKILGWIVPGFEFEAKEHGAIDAAELAFVRDPSSTRTSARSTHVGFGLSHCLPVITSAVALEHEGLLLTENPEAHLHPQSQSRIGRFLAMAATCGPQIFLETHSDHVINGIRLAVKNRLIAANEVRLFNFTRNSSTDSSAVESLTVGEDGSLSSWPSGFFDQIEKDLIRL